MNPRNFSTPYLALRIGAILLASILWAHSAEPSSVQLDRARLAEIPNRMQTFVENRTVAGAVTLVARRGQIARIDAVGFADLAAKKPMREDALFWVASMTKPITAAAVLILQDEGRLNVDDPVEKHLPEFKNQWMVAERSDTRRVLAPAPRPITLRDLLTHTSGLGDVPSPRPDCSLAELCMAYAREPLQFPPGSRWQYSNPGINTLGRVVEVVSGQAYAEFLQTRLFDPLGMKDTTFWPGPGKLVRVAKSYQPGNEGGLAETEISFLRGGLSNRKRTAFPAGGLFSTARDMARFYQMMLAEGTWNGKRLVSREAIRLMTQTQTGELKTGFTDGMSFGFGFAVVRQPAGVTSMLSAGSFGHGGAFGTQSWADPAKDLILILMIQRARLPNADNSELRRVFQETAASALAD